QERLGCFTEADLLLPEPNRSADRVGAGLNLDTFVLVGAGEAAEVRGWLADPYDLDASAGDRLALQGDELATQPLLGLQAPRHVGSRLTEREELPAQAVAARRGQHSYTIHAMGIIARLARQACRQAKPAVAIGLAPAPGGGQRCRVALLGLLV